MNRTFAGPLGAMIAVAAVALVPSLGSAADSCGGGCPKLPKETRSVSLVTVPRPAAPAILLQATLRKALKKRLIKVDAVMTTGIYTPALPSTLALSADANGIPMQPSLVSPVVVDCGGGGGAPLGPPSFACTVTGSWWLDTDDPANAALLASPSPPLTVTLTGGEMFPPAVGAPIDISMSVNMGKKK